ncbi:hypothetical protein LINGRAHAP2_LOCUS1896 [Linum grandiflorum]
MLDETNVLVQSFRQIHGLLATSENRSLRLRVVAKRTPVERQYELPTGTELAGLIPDDFQPDRGDRDIIIHSQQSGLVRISTMHPKFDALHLPLLFPHGNDGFHSGIAYDPTHVSSTRKRYQAHMNVKLCHKGRLIKYLFKYITKGPAVDEVSQYLDFRSISCYGAIWHLFAFKIHERIPSVTCLAVHLPGQQPVAFHRNESLPHIMSRRNAGCTTLTEWFELNKRCHNARKYTYGEIPNHFTWNKKQCDWYPQKKVFLLVESFM